MKFKTEQEILLQMVDKAQEQNLISEADDLIEKIANNEQTENQYVLDLATHAHIIHDFTQMLEYMYEGVDIATARGDQLDKIGNLVNVQRNPGIPAQLELQLSLSLPESSDIVIPSGTEVIIDELQVDPYLTYTTDSSVTLKAGTTSASVTASSDFHALQRRVQAECVRGLKGYPILTVNNHYDGTSGRNIENDEDYRQRILLWNVKNTVGTKAAFDAYLGQVQGLDDYRLIARADGVGTLTIVCDCIESQLPVLQQAIQENCMLFTDDPVECVNPSRTPIDVSLTARITSEPIQHTVAEIIELLSLEVKAFINGGRTREGDNISGLRIGETFVPSQLVMHLHNLFPELVSIECSTVETSISEYNKFLCTVVEVVVE